MKTKIVLRLLIALHLAVPALQGAPLSSVLPHTGELFGVAFSPDGNKLASVSTDGVKVWDVAAGRELLSLTGHEGAVYSVTFSPDGKTLASSSGDSTVKIWDAVTGKELRSLTGHEGAVYSVTFSPDGKTLASGSEDNTVKIWDAVTGKEVATFSGHSETVTSVAFSPDGKTLAGGSVENTVKLWDALTGNELVSLTGHEGAVFSVTFSPDGKTLASSSGDNTVKLWDAVTGKELRSFTEHEGSVFSVTFSPDGKTLASGSGDNTVRVWDAATGKELASLTNHEETVRCVRFSADGSKLASASIDESVRVWNVVKALQRGKYRTGGEALYERLYAAARFDTRKEIIAKGTSTEELEIAFQKAKSKTDAEADELELALSSLVSTEQTSDFKFEDNESFKNALKLRDALFRNLLVIKVVADYVAMDPAGIDEKARFAEEATLEWTKIVQRFLKYYPTLANDEIGKAEKEELKTWYRKLRFVARRNILSADELLRAAPDAATLQLLDESRHNECLEIRAKLLSLEADFGEVLKICGSLAQSNPELADTLAESAVQFYAVTPDYAGRSERGRDAARSLRASDFGAFVQGLGEITELSRYRNAIPKSFADFCRYHRPVERNDLDLMLDPLPQRSEAEIVDFTSSMLNLLKDVTTASPKGDEPAMKMDGKDWAARIGQEYAALDGVLAEWQKGRKSWRSELLRAETQFAWANHQLNFVEIPNESVSKTVGKESETKATKSDAEGFRKHVGEWRASISSSAAKLLADETLDGEARIAAASEILSAWFAGTMTAREELAYPKKESDSLLEQIDTWLGQLPPDVSGPVLDAFVLQQLARLDPPPDDKNKPIEHERRFDFVEAVTSLAPEAKSVEIFQGLLDDYRKLSTGVRFYVVPEGEIYDAGKWADGAFPTFPVDGREFGVWFTLIHTTGARKASGGFRRYAKSAANTVSADDYDTLSETERTKYAEDFQKYLEHQLTESFEVVLVAPNTKPDVSREFNLPDGKWQETPLYYAVLRPKGDSPALEIPSLRMDLDFAHNLGRVVLPFNSQRVPLLAGKGKASHLREVEVEQFLDDANRDQGELKLTISSESLGLPPQPRDHAGNFPSEGFELDDSQTTSEVKVLGFPAGKNAAHVQRTTTYHLDWRGGGISTTFRYPTFGGSVANGSKDKAWKVDDFLKRQGQIKERHVPKGEVGLYGLPWHWSFASQWLGSALRWIAITVGALLLLLVFKRLRSQPKREPEKIFPLLKPVTTTPLAAANFLRRIESAKAIPLSESQLEALHDDVERLENLALQNDPASTGESATLIDKWLHVARERFIAG